MINFRCDVIVNDERIPTKAKVLSLVSGVDAIYCAYFRIDKEVIEAAGDIIFNITMTSKSRKSV